MHFGTRRVSARRPRHLLPTHEEADKQVNLTRIRPNCNTSIGS
jgi:hypothetical protein